ncbi:MAG: EamA family transporter [Deltaproteobacteria bacterium]|nr:EamA family transporter [Deltaproteobacteria bacterium]
MFQTKQKNIPPYSVMILYKHPLIWCLLSAFLFGISPALSKWALGTIKPISMAAFLYLGAGLATLPFSKKPQITQKKEWARILGAILFGGILGPIFLMYGIQEIGGARSALLLNFESVATVILGWIFFREHITFTIILSVFFVTIGGLCLSFSQEQAGLTLNIGALYIIVACFCWGLDNHYTAVIEQLTPAQSTCIKGICAGLFNLLLAYFLETDVIFSYDIGIVLFAFLIGALSYGASIVLYIAGAQQIGATRAQLIFASAPYWGILTAVLLFQESFSSIHLAATGCMLLALYIQNKESHGHEHIHTQMTHKHWHRHDDDHHHHHHKTPSTEVLGWHIHEHEHNETSHIHSHYADIHHRHH